ncbi:MAG: ATP-binding protein [Arcticibacter sp.]
MPNPVKAIHNIALLVLYSIFLFSFCNLGSVVAQVNEEFHVTHYTSRNGLPQNSVKSMFMDKNRFLWMTTEGGLVRFDGFDFDIYNTSNIKGLTNDRLGYLIPAASGELYADDIDGNILKIADSKVRMAHKVQASRFGGFILRGQTPDLNFLINSDKQQISGLIKGETTGLLNVIPLNKGLFAISIKSGFAIYSTDENKIISRTSLPEGQKYSALFGLDGKVFLFDQSGQCYVSSPDGKTITSIQTIGFDGLPCFDHNIIMNSLCNQAYLKFKNKLFRILFDQQSNTLSAKLVLEALPDNIYVSSAFFDSKSQSFFISTTTNGFFIYRKKFIKTLVSPEPDNIHANCYYSQFEIDSNRVCGGWDAVFSEKGFEKSNIKLEQGTNLIQFMLKYNDHRILYTPGNSLRSYDLKSNNYTFIDSIGTEQFYAMHSEGDSVIVTSSIGLYSYRNGILLMIAKHGLKGFNQRVTTIYRPNNNSIWLGYCDGILEFDQQSKAFKQIPEANGLCVRTIEKIKDVLLIGTYGQGIYAMSHGKMIKLPTDIDNKLLKTHSFLLDKNGLLWMSTNTGLVNVIFNDLLSYITDSTSTPFYYYYGVSDGILNTEFNGGCSPTYIRLKNGYVSYPTMEGLVWLKPEEVTRDIPNEEIFIDKILINGFEHNAGEKLIVPSYYDEVQIYFSTPYWGNMENIHVEYRIIGLFDQWRPTEGGGRWIDFANLNNGNYTLQIRNAISSNREEDVIFEIPFEVKPEFYETWGFIAGSICAGLMLLWGIFRLNSQRVISRNKSLEIQVKKRTTDLQSTNETLNSTVKELQQKEYKLRESIRIKDKLISIISHDIITPIKFLSIVSKMSGKAAKENPDGLKESLDNMKYIGAAAEKIYNNAANILNWMKLQNELITVSLENIGLCDFVEEVMEPFVDVIDQNSIQLENNVPEEEIIVSDPNILKIILQNLISNATKHTKTGRIEISSFIDTSGFPAIRVKDTGIGIPEKILAKINTIKKHAVTGEFDADDPDTGNQLGYFIIFDFARLIGASVEISSEVGKGTEVKVILPPPRKIS